MADDASAVSPLSLATNGPLAVTRDARLPPLLGTGDSVSVHLVARNKQVVIASGVKYKAWTVNGSVPGPILHLRQGQTVHVTFTNHGTMPHSIDLHAAVTPPNVNYVQVAPGDTLRFSFVAETPGVFLYHCGTPPALLHIGNGMYGAVVVDPKQPLPPAAASYVIVQSEWYTRRVAGRLMAGDFRKMSTIRPDEVVFNGAAFQYRDHPLVVEAGKRVRLYFVDAGPNLWSSFHVIGAIFDTVYPDANAAHALTGVSTYTVGPGAGAIFDLVISKPGKYPFVDHAMAHANIGAIGVLDVRRSGTVGNRGDVQTPTHAGVADVPAVGHAETVAANRALPGTYAYDATRGQALYVRHCSACHQRDGRGLAGAFPPLRHDAVVLDPDPARQIRTIIHGLHGKRIDGKRYPAMMPTFAGKLTATQIADIVNYERSSWGNHGAPVSAADVRNVLSDGVLAERDR